MENDFDLVAPFYDQLAGLIFGKSIRNSQRWLMPFIPENANVLIIGGGTGWILEEVLAHTKAGKIVYLEASAKMLELSKKRYAGMGMANSTEVDFRLGTEASLKESETFDIVFTGFLLDLFQPENLRKLMQRLNSHLKPSGLWLVADFHPQNAVKLWQRVLLKTMVRFFRITANLQATQLPDLEKAFSAFPFELKASRFFYKGLIRSAVYYNQAVSGNETAKKTQ